MNPDNLFPFNGIDLSDYNIFKIGWGEPILIPKSFTTEEEKYLLASQLTIAFGNKSVDNTLRTYLADFEQKARRTSASKGSELLEGALTISKNQQQELNNILTNLKVYSESNMACLLALSRLSVTFSSVHSLLMLGQHYESLALARLILEQLAYVFTASTVEEDKADYMSPTKSITKLSKFDVKVGRLYGILSKKAHIDKSEIPRYIKIEDGRTYILQSSTEFALEASTYLLALLDIQYSVFEFSFRKHLKSFSCIELVNGTYRIKKDRKTNYLIDYIEKIESYLAETRG